MYAGAFDRVAEIFEAARGMGRDARPPYLDEACDGDRELLVAVEGLLSAHEDKISFLDDATANIFERLDVSPDLLLSIYPPVEVDAAFPSFHPSGGDSGAPGGRYIQQREIARGGMGVVFEARDRDLGRRIAVKRMRGTPLDAKRDPEARETPPALTRFVEEARVTAQLDHPGVIPVHDLALDDGGQAYFTMRLVEGRDLAEVFRLARLEKESWNLSRALGVVIKVCQTMAFAHSRGVVHRDLKPSNVMVGSYGEVYVMDWGLAKTQGQQDLHGVRIRPCDRAGESHSMHEFRDRAPADAARNLPW